MRVWSGSKFCLLWLVFLSILSTIVFRPSYGDIVQDLDDDDDNGGSSSKRRMINFASHQAGAVIVDRAPSNGKGFNNLLNDDRDKYAICSSNERKWVVVGLSEEVAITSVAIANYEKYSSTVRDFQLLGSLKYPTTEWNDLGTYTAQLMLGEQHFNITVTDSSHTRYLKIKFLSHYLDEELFTLSQIKVFGQTVFASLQDEVALSEENDIKMLLQDVRDDLQREDWLLSNESEDTSGSASSSSTEASASITIEPTASINGQDAMNAQNLSADTTLVANLDPAVSETTGGTGVEDQGQPGEAVGEEIDSIRPCSTNPAGESTCLDSSHEHEGSASQGDARSTATPASDSLVSNSEADDRSAPLTTTTTSEEIPSTISPEKDAVTTHLEAVQTPLVDHSFDGDETHSVDRESTPIHHDDALHLNQTEWGLVHTALQRANLTADILTQAYQSMKGFMVDSASKKIDVSRLLQYISSQKGPVKHLDASSTEEQSTVGSSSTDHSSTSPEPSSSRSESPDTVDTSSTATNDAPSTATEDRHASRNDELVGQVTAEMPSDSPLSSSTTVETPSSMDDEQTSSTTTSTASDVAESNNTTVEAMPPVDELASILSHWPIPPAPPSSFPTILSADESIASPVDASGAPDALPASVSATNETMDNASTTTTAVTTPPLSETMSTTAQQSSSTSTSTSTSTLAHDINPTQTQPAKPSTSSSSSSSAPSGFHQQQVHWMTCMDQLKFSEFQGRLMAKLQQKNGSTSMDTTSIDVNAPTASPGVNHNNIFKQIIQRMKTLETNQAITEIYLSQLSDCLRLIRDEMMERQQAQEEHDLRAQQNPLSALFTLALSNITMVSAAQGAPIFKIPSVLPTTAPTTATTAAASSPTSLPATETIILPTTYSPFLLPLLAPPTDAPFDAFWSRMVSFLRSLIRIMSQFVWIVTLAGKHDQATLLTSTLQELRLLLQSSVIEFWCALVCGLVIALVAGIMVVLMMCMWMMVWCCCGLDRREADHRLAARRRYVQQ